HLQIARKVIPMPEPLPPDQSRAPSTRSDEISHPGPGEGTPSTRWSQAPGSPDLGEVPGPRPSEGTPSTQASVTDGSLPNTIPPPPETLAGAQWSAPFAIGRYRAVRFHARGGLGEVHLAEDLELQRPVALKRIRPEHADNSECRRRFLLEAEVTAHL